MAYWRPIQVDGKELDLSHLEPFEFEIVPKDWSHSAVISVRFHDHCFTETYNSSIHSTVLVSSNASKNESRAFSVVRYELSLLLPELIRSFDSKRVSSSRHGNLVRIEAADGKDYGIFFQLRKTDNRRCVLYVVSAYPLDRPRKSIVTTGEMKFNVAIALVLKGKTPRFPRRGG